MFCNLFFLKRGFAENMHLLSGIEIMLGIDKGHINRLWDRAEMIRDLKSL